MIYELNDEMIFVLGLKQTVWFREWLIEYSTSCSFDCVKMMHEKYYLNSNDFKLY